MRNDHCKLLLYREKMINYSKIFNNDQMNKIL